jgi:hypothetical protein
MPERGPALKMLPNPDRLGRTEPNAAGRTYRHGTLSAYAAGRCRCEHCKGAFAQYRRQRRAAGMDDPRTPRIRDTDGHIPRDWLRNQVWKPALAAAGVTAVRPHDLRHAHASWLLAGGADLQAVKERLGHASMATTEKYLHKPSGIASDGRVCAGRLVSRVPQWPWAAGGRCGLTWPVAR